MSRRLPKKQFVKNKQTNQKRQGMLSNQYWKRVVPDFVMKVSMDGALETQVKLWIHIELVYHEILRKFKLISKRLKN